MKKDWNEGYVSDHSYGHYYFGQLSPSFLKGLLCLSGYAPPKKRGHEPLRYLELGFGQGLSLNLHAAVDQDSEFWGTDFLPEQFENAQTLSQKAQLGTHVFNLSFADFEKQCEEYPFFDMIILHGIWTWVNEENRQHLLNIISKKLKPKGLVYLSYNAMPGQTLLLPMRYLMCLYANRKVKEKDSLIRAQKALKFINEMSSARFFTDNLLTQKINTITAKDPTYIAHEYLNRDWDNFYFIEVASSLYQVGCTYAVSARHLDAFSFAQAPDTLDFMNEITDPLTKEALRDFNLYQGFRSDIYVKESVPLTKEDYEAQLKTCFFALMAPLSHIQLPLSLELTHFQGTLEPSLYEPILKALAKENYAPKTIDSLLEKLPHLTFDQLIFCLNVLVGAFYVTFANPNPSEKSLKASCRFNRLMCQEKKQHYLASPVLGCGLNTPPYVQRLLLAYALGKKDVKELTFDLKEKFKDFRLKLDGTIFEGEKAFSLAAQQFIKERSFYETMKLIPYEY